MLDSLTADAAASGGRALSGRAIPGGGTYRAFSSALAPVLRTLPADPPEELRPYRAALARLAPAWSSDSDVGGSRSGVDPVVLVGEGLLLLLAGTTGPAGCLLALEDLHWADPDTLALVGYLADATRSASVLIVATARDDQAARADATDAPTLDELAQLPAVTTVRLGRLADDAVADIAGRRSGRPLSADELATVLRRADGLPVVVDDLVSAVQEGGDTSAAVPGTMAGLVRRRMASLTESGRAVLRAAAVLGADPDWSLLTTVTGLDRARALEALRAGTAAGLLVADGLRLGWRHALTREAVLATMLAPELADVALRAAETIAAQADPDQDRLEADLRAIAGDRAGAGSLLLRLAGRDMARGAVRSALDLVDQAESIGADAGEVALVRVDLLTLTGHTDRALTAGTAALPALTGEPHAELCLGLAGAAITAGQWQAAREYVHRAGRPDDPRSSILSAEAAFGLGDVPRAAALAEAAARRAEELGQVDSVCAALLVVGRCAEISSLDAGPPVFARAAQYAAEHGLLHRRVEALFGLGRTELPDRGAEVLRQTRDLAMDAGLLGHALSIEIILIELVTVDEGPRAAQPSAAGTAERAGRLGLTGLQALAEVIIALALADAGDVAGMTQMLAQAVARPYASREVTATAAVVRGVHAVLTHERVNADRLVDGGLRPLAQHGSAAPFAYWGLWVVLRAAVSDDDWPRRLVSAKPVAGRSMVRGALLFADAIAAGRAGDAASAAELSAAANDVLAGQHWWRRLLRLVVLESAVLDGWGDPVPELRADLAEFERLGQDVAARTCRDLLRQAGAPTRRGRGSGAVPPRLRAAGVTSREVDVLDLVIQGLSNAQIAERLFLSRRTVETHVASLLAKLGASDRADLRTRYPPGPR